MSDVLAEMQVPLDTLPEKEQIKLLCELQATLEARVAKGEIVVQDLLAKTDGENPEYLKHKARLDQLKAELTAVQKSLWSLWYKGDVRITLSFPKNIGLAVPYLRDGKPFGSTEDANFFHIPVTWNEYETLIYPFLDMPQNTQS